MLTTLIDHFSTHEAGRILGVSASRVRQLIREGRLPGVKVSGVYLIPSKMLYLVSDRKAGYPRGRPRKAKPRTQ